MKKGEIWVSKEHEEVRIDYIEYDPSLPFDDYFVGYSYLENPKDHEQPTIEDMVSRKWFVSNFTKCRDK